MVPFLFIEFTYVQISISVALVWTDFTVDEYILGGGFNVVAFGSLLNARINSNSTTCITFNMQFIKYMFHSLSYNCMHD